MKRDQDPIIGKEKNFKVQKLDDTREREDVDLIQSSRPPPAMLPVFSHIKLFAYRNTKGRFFVPSSDNTVAGLTVKHIMFDTGCNTSLFPLEGTSDIDHLVKQYWDPSSFFWEIHLARDVGGTLFDH